MPGEDAFVVGADVRGSAEFFMLRLPDAVPELASVLWLLDEVAQGIRPEASGIDG